jgi:predicted phage terminase large subunit-like protein
VTTLTSEFTYSAAQSYIFFESRAYGRFRFFPKGRRLGATKGGSQAFIEWALEGDPLLWGDTTHGNIDRYVARYFLPVLKRNNIEYSWQAQKNLMTIGTKGGYIDFRSADRPENWEGFGYKRIFLNEAGIILDDNYLYENAVLPMLMDYADSELIAAGTPKLRQGTGRLFKELVEKALHHEPDYHTKTFTSYDNPFLSKKAVDSLAAQISSIERPQEIYGKFVEPGGELFKRENIRYAIKPPNAAMHIALAADLAIRDKTKNDWTAVVVFGQEKFGQQRKFVLDAARVRGGFQPAIDLIIKMQEKWRAARVGIEAVQFQAAVSQQLLRTTNLPIVELMPDKDKVTRAFVLSARYEQHMIYHAQDEAGENIVPQHYEDELLAFPNSDHDDQVDAAVYAHGLLPSLAPIEIQRTGPRENNATLSKAQNSQFGFGTTNNSLRGFD